MGGLIFMLFPYFIVPIGIVKAFGTSWKTILIAYGVWFGALLLFGLTNGQTVGEKFGWPLILGMFLTIPAILVLVLILRLCGFR